MTIRLHVPCAAIVLWFSAPLMLFAFATPGLGQQKEVLTFLKAEPRIVEQRLTPSPATQKERLRLLRSQFLKAKVYGAGPVEEQKVPGQAEPNLICTIPGKEDSVIIVAAQADYKEGGDQAQVNWSTLVMLPLLVESLAAVVSRHTLVFVAFTGGKGEHSGASAYVQQLTDAQRKRIHAVIELDHIGRTPPSFAARSRADRLGGRLRAVANALKLEELPRMYLYGPTGAIEGNGPISDTFDSGQIPAITIYSRDHYEPPGLVINGIQKSLRKTAIDPKAYYNTYLLLCMYVRQIDRDLPSSEAPKK